MPKLSIPLPKSSSFAFGQNIVSIWKHQIFYGLETKNIFIKLHKLNWTYLTLNIIANHYCLHFLNIAVHSLLHQIWHAKEVVDISFFSSHFSNVPFMSHLTQEISLSNSSSIVCMCYTRVQCVGYGIGEHWKCFNRLVMWRIQL